MNIDLKLQYDYIEDYIKKYMEENDPNIILQLRMLPGVGKTFTTLKYFTDRIDQYNFIYLSSMHSIIENNLKLIMGENYDDIIHLRGRGKLCINKEYRKLENYGVNISSLCNDCPYKDNCEYYKILYDVNREVQSWVGVYEHLITQVPKYYEDYGNEIDVIILDECFLSRICQTKLINLETLDYTKRVTNEVRGRNKTKNKLQIWIEELQKGFGTGKFNFDVLKTIKIEDKKFKKSYNQAMIEHWRSTPKREIYRNIIPDIFFLSQHLRDDDDYNNSLIYRDFKNIYFNIFRKDVLNLPIKTIILDATTPPEIYDELTGKAVYPIDSEIYPDVNVYQFTTAKYCMSTLNRRDKNGNYPAREKLFHYTEGICRKHADEKVLIVCRKKYEKSLQDHLEAEGLDNFATNHYDGLRGSNQYMDYGVCVLMGGAYRNKDDLERSATLMEISKEDLEKQVTKNEMVQCLHRIRPILKRGKTWYILSNEELKFSFPSDKVKKLDKYGFEKMIFGDVRDKRIRNDILELTKNKDYSRTEIIKKVKGDMHIINNLINELVKEKQLKKIEEKRKGVRPSVRYIRNY